MSWLSKLLGEKEEDVLAEKRIVVASQMQMALQSSGVTSFRVQVEGKDSKYNDCIVLVSTIPKNRELEEFIEKSLTRKHTATNLSSIGFKRILVLFENDEEYALEIPLAKLI